MKLLKIYPKHKILQQYGGAKGFTLVELLVSISIISILSSIGLVTYQKAQIYARNQRRKEDLQSIKAALLFYHSEQGFYPAGRDTSTATSPLDIDEKADPLTACTGNPEPSCNEDAVYLSKTPVDPTMKLVRGVYSYPRSYKFMKLGDGLTHDIHYCYVAYPINNPSDFTQCDNQANNKCSGFALLAELEDPNAPTVDDGAVGNYNAACGGGHWFNYKITSN